MKWSTDDYGYMALALQLAKNGQYTARPNPMVGCVIVKNGQIIGQGYHQNFGQAHAEINALKQAGTEAKGATCYVTLEPCSHTGKTGSCAKALIAAEVAEVISAMQDPNPQVSGNGFNLLESAGIKTSFGLLKEQAEVLNKGFINKFQKNKSWITLKLAMSLDGRTALADCSSKWITGSAARQDVQKLRAKQDAIITGIGTVLADNPSLNVRAENQEPSENNWFNCLQNFKQPMRILLDRSGKANLSSKIFNQNADVLWLSNNQKTLDRVVEEKKPNVKVIAVMDLEDLINYCAKEGMNNILLEAGHKLAGEFLKQNLIDEIIIYIAPKLMGDHAMGLFELNILNMKDCPKLTLKDIRQFGDDIRLTYVPLNSSS